VFCRFTQVRARKLAEAAAIVNELLLKARALLTNVLAHCVVQVHAGACAQAGGGCCHCDHVEACILI
jgi:hypothetical protein